MSRKPNQLDTVPVKFSSTDRVRKYLEQLVETGLYGRNVPEAVDRLVSHSIQQLIKEGILHPQDPAK